MFSLKSLEAFDLEAADALLAAIRAVAEENFFAITVPCDAGTFAELAVRQPRWLVARVQFEEGPLAGSVSCTLPEELAHVLLDAFSGWEPSAPAPTYDQVLDLVGEFSNMVCGSWLTRITRHQAFTLSRPVVEPALAPAHADGPRLFVAVRDLPLAVDVRLQSVTQDVRPEGFV